MQDKQPCPNCCCKYFKIWETVSNAIASGSCRQGKKKNLFTIRQPSFPFPLQQDVCQSGEYIYR